MSTLRTTGADLASVLSNLTSQMVENVPIAIFRDCARIVQCSFEVIDEMTGELSAEKCAALKRTDPRWWTDGSIESRRIVEHWKWHNALALADMPAEIRQCRADMIDAGNRVNGSSDPFRRKAHKARLDALNAEYQELCKKHGWSD